MGDSLCFTNGIGDWIVFDSILSDARLSEVSRIYWAINGADSLIPICEAMPAYAAIEHIDVWGDYRDWRGFHDADHLMRSADRTGRTLPDGIDDAEELSPRTWHRRMGDWHPSRLLSTGLADLSGLGLPAQYVACQFDTPLNVPAYRKLRSLNEPEIRRIDAALGRFGLPGVVIDLPGDPLPDGCPNLIDLRGRATLAQAFECVKRAEGYAGIDSCLSVLASQVFADRPGRLLVRSHNLGMLRSAWAEYYRPARAKPPWLVWAVREDTIGRVGCFRP